MNKINYDVEMEKIISSLSFKPKLLLHACCAPCSSTCIMRLKEEFDITVYFYNPNIDTASEYAHRAKEQARFCSEIGVNCVIEEYDKEKFYSAVKGKETEKEGGARCFICYELRLKKTKDYADAFGYDYFATTLTLSPLKNAEKLNEIGLNLQKDGVAKYLPSDFKKKNGYLNSIALSKEYRLYRQNYCGCEFSKKNTRQK